VEPLDHEVRLPVGFLEVLVGWPDLLGEAIETPFDRHLPSAGSSADGHVLCVVRHTSDDRHSTDLTPRRAFSSSP
jgi:hypothetical protein